MICLGWMQAKDKKLIVQHSWNASAISYDNFVRSNSWVNRMYLWNLQIYRFNLDFRAGSLMISTTFMNFWYFAILHGVYCPLAVCFSYYCQQQLSITWKFLEVDYLSMNFTSNFIFRSQNPIRIPLRLWYRQPWRFGRSSWYFSFANVANS